MRRELRELHVGFMIYINWKQISQKKSMQNFMHAKKLHRTRTGTWTGIGARAGTRTRMMIVANRMPNPRLAAMGIRNWACRLFSRIKGRTPRKVVIDVSRIGRNLA